MTSLPSNPSTWAARPLPAPYIALGPARGAARFRRIFSARPMRVMLLLAAVWLLNGFDLLFTILANRLGCFIELNPVAARVLGDNNYIGIILYKMALVGVSTWILWKYRHYRLTEMSCWLVALLYAGLAFHWHHYYQVWNYYCYHDGVYYLSRASAP